MKSSNTSVCTVKGGKITAVGAGTATIKMYFAGYENGASTRKITVTDPSVARLTFNPNGGTVTTKTKKRLYLHRLVHSKKRRHKSNSRNKNIQKPDPVCTLDKDNGFKGRDQQADKHSRTETECIRKYNQRRSWLSVHICRKE